MRNAQARGIIRGMGGKNLYRRPLKPAQDDRHALASMTDPATRVPADYYGDPDPDLDCFCPACTPEWADGGWQHERSCVMRRAG